MSAAAMLVMSARRERIKYMPQVQHGATCRDRKLVQPRQCRLHCETTFRQWPRLYLRRHTSNEVQRDLATNASSPSLTSRQALEFLWPGRKQGLEYRKGKWSFKGQTEHIPITSISKLENERGAQLLKIDVITDPGSPQVD